MTVNSFEPENRDTEKNSIWIGMEVYIPDRGKNHDPEEMTSTLREWTEEFLREGKTNVDFDVTGVGFDARPAHSNWPSNPLFVRYKPESWDEWEEAPMYRTRGFDIWFPILDYFEHHKLETFKRKYTYIVGDKVYEHYGSEIDVRGMLVAGSKVSLQEHYNSIRIADIDVDQHIQ